MAPGFKGAAPPPEMRRSSRLAGKPVNIQAAEDEHDEGNEDEHDEGNEDDKNRTTSALQKEDGESRTTPSLRDEEHARSPPRGKRRGRPRKQPTDASANGPSRVQRAEDEVFSGGDETSDAESDAFIPPATRKAKTAAAVSSPAARKSLRRIKQAMPPVERRRFPEQVSVSAATWAALIARENAAFKRRSRWMRTQIFVRDEQLAEDPQSAAIRRFCSATTTVASDVDPLPLDIDCDGTEMTIAEAQLLTEEEALLNGGDGLMRVLFCECLRCRGDAEGGLIFAVRREGVAVFQFRMTERGGLRQVRRVGVVPFRETITSCSAVPRTTILTVTTAHAVFLVEGGVFHDAQVAVHQRLVAGVEGIVTNGAISCHCWGRGGGDALLLLGTQMGRVHLFAFPATEPPRCVFETGLPGGEPVYSLAWTDWAFLVAGKASRIVRIDLNDPFVQDVEVAMLASLPLVAWSEPLQLILFADGDNHGRTLRRVHDSQGRIHQPLGTFDSTVEAIATSESHGIIATAISSGSIQLSWLSVEAASSVEFEKRIATLTRTSTQAQAQTQTRAPLSLSLQASFVPFQQHDAVKLYPCAVAAVSVGWSANARFPGLLVAGFRSGLVLLRVMDRFFI